MSRIKANIQVAPQDLLISSTSAGTDIGAYATTGDGRVFRYAKAGAVTLVPGTLLQGPAEDTTNYQNLAPVAAAAAATTVTIATSTTVAVNALAGGFMAVTTGAGYGYTYKIAGNAVSAASSLTIYLEDPIVVALTTASRLDVHPSPFNGVVVNPTTATSTPVGVAVSAIPASNYGWIQTHGPATLAASGALTVGLAVAPSTTIAGMVVLSTSAVTTPVVGQAITGVASLEAGLVFVELD